MTTDPTLITGVGKRAGFHIARAFLLRGMPVIGTFRTRYGRLDELDDLGAELHRCDFNERSDVESLIRTVTAGHQRLRGIIHNASDWMCDDADIPVNQIIETMMRVHANVPYELNHALAPLLKACSDAHADIVHIGDYVSSRPITAGRAGAGAPCDALPALAPRDRPIGPSRIRASRTNPPRCFWNR